MTKTRIIVLLLTLAILLVAFAYKTASAVITFPFGGRIFFFIPCANGTLYYIGPPSNGFFMYMYGVARLYARFQLIIPNYVLGNYFPGGVCICPYNNCYAGAIVAKGTITMVGTGSSFGF